MGAKIVEDENHLLYNCDLYAGLRAKLINRLNNAPEHQNNSHPQLSINSELLKDHLINLLSPYTNTENEVVNTFNMHHKIINHESESFQHRRSYIINCVCTFLCRALEKRRKYIKDLRERDARINTIVIKFNNTEIQM